VAALASGVADGTGGDALAIRVGGGVGHLQTGVSQEPHA
jgi:hypothetical protein